MAELIEGRGMGITKVRIIVGPSILEVILDQRGRWLAPLKFARTHDRCRAPPQTANKHVELICLLIHGLGVTLRAHTMLQPWWAAPRAQQCWHGLPACIQVASQRGLVRQGL